MAARDRGRYTLDMRRAATRPTAGVLLALGLAGAPGCVTAATYHALVKPSPPDYFEMKEPVAARAERQGDAVAVTVRVRLDDGRDWEFGPLLAAPPKPTPIPIAPRDPDESPVAGRPAPEAPLPARDPVLLGSNFRVGETSPVPAEPPDGSTLVALDPGPVNFPRGHAFVQARSRALFALARPEKPASVPGACAFALLAPFTVVADVVTSPVQLVMYLYVRGNPRGGP
jgi:hypothetical protein